MLRLWRKWIAYPLWWLVIMAAGLAFLAWTPNLGKVDPPMESFAGRYVATTNGEQVQLRVTERITVRLQGERGIYRDLITTYGGHDLGITDIEVETDGVTEPVVPSNLANGDLRISLGGNMLQWTTEQYVLHYTITNAMVGTEDYQEIYLNVNGLNWPNAFRRVSAEVEVSGELADALTGQVGCYQGKAGSRDRCTLHRDGDTFSMPALQLGAHENATIAIGFEPGTVASVLPPVPGASLGWWGIVGMLGIGALALGVALVLRAWARDLGEDAPGLVTQFTPPEKPRGITPLTAADFLGRPEKGPAALLTAMVVEGYGTLEMRDSAQLFGDFDAQPGAADLGCKERARLAALLEFRWTNGDGVPNEYRRQARGVLGSEGTTRTLTSIEYLADVDRVALLRDNELSRLNVRHRFDASPAILWSGYLALVVFGLIQLFQGLAGLGWWFLLAGTLAVLMVLWATHLTPRWGRLTREGRELRRHLAGLERFVSASEANRISWLQNARTAPREADRLKLYERLLPWAIVFGAERSWSQLLGELQTNIPRLSGSTSTPSTSITRLHRLSAWSGSIQQEDPHRRADRRSPWAFRPDVGEGAGTRFTRSVGDLLSDMSSGRSSSNSSTRSSGRGWSGGSSSSRSGGGSRGGGRSGGGIGGGGGGRR